MLVGGRVILLVSMPAGDRDADLRELSSFADKRWMPISQSVALGVVDAILGLPYYLGT